MASVSKSMEEQLNLLLEEAEEELEQLEQDSLGCALTVLVQLEHTYFPFCFLPFFFLCSLFLISFRPLIMSGGRQSRLILIRAR